MAGATIKEIQEFAGHKTITMSARYSHLSPEHRLSVIDRVATAAPRRNEWDKKVESNSHQNSHQTKTVTRYE
jgi:hypothetical protein